MTFIEGRDAAFPTDIGTFAGVVQGYMGGTNAFNVWNPEDWNMFPSNYKVPTWVAGDNGEKEGAKALDILGILGARNCLVVLDMEGRRDDTYVRNFGTVLQGRNYIVVVYGSLESVFSNPQLNGYQVADWTGNEHMAINPETGNSRGIRSTQYASGAKYDSSVWKEWTVRKMWR